MSLNFIHSKMRIIISIIDNLVEFEQFCTLKIMGIILIFDGMLQLVGYFTAEQEMEM